MTIYLIAAALLLQLSVSQHLQYYPYQMPRQMYQNNPFQNQPITQPFNYAFNRPVQRQQMFGYAIRNQQPPLHMFNMPMTRFPSSPLSPALHQQPQQQQHQQQHQQKKQQQKQPQKQHQHQQDYQHQQQQQHQQDYQHQQQQQQQFSTFTASGSSSYTSNAPQVNRFGSTPTVLTLDKARRKPSPKATGGGSTGETNALVSVDALDAGAVSVSTIPLHNSIPRVSAGNTTMPVLFKVITGPLPARSTRAPLNLGIVLDKSGSMSGDKIHSAREAIVQIIEQLHSDDIIHLITYADDAQLVFAMGNPVEQRDELIEFVRGIQDDGATNLGAGLELAAEVLPLVTDDRYNRRLFVFSDGQLTEGIKRVEGINQLVSSMSAPPLNARIDSFGIGEGFDAEIMETVAAAGLGTFFFLESPEFISTVVQNAFGNLRDVVGQSATLTIRAVAPLTTGIERTNVEYDVQAREGEVCGPSDVWAVSLGLECETGLVCAPLPPKDLSGESAEEPDDDYGVYGYMLDFMSICQQPQPGVDVEAGKERRFNRFGAPAKPTSNAYTASTSVSIQLGDLPASNSVSHLVDLRFAFDALAIPPGSTVAAEWALTYSNYNSATEQWEWSTIDGTVMLQVLSKKEQDVVKTEVEADEVRVALVVQMMGKADDMVKQFLEDQDAFSAIVVQKRQIEELEAVQSIDESGFVTSLLTMARDALEKLEVEGASQNMVQIFNHQSYVKGKGDSSYGAQFAAVAGG